MHIYKSNNVILAKMHYSIKHARYIDRVMQFQLQFYRITGIQASQLPIFFKTRVQFSMRCMCTPVTVRNCIIIRKVQGPELTCNPLLHNHFYENYKEGTLNSVKNYFSKK